MNRNMRIGAILAVLVLVIVVIPISYSWSKESTKQDLFVHTLQVEYQGGISTVSGVLTNQTDHDILISQFTLLLFNSQKETIFEEPLYLGEVLKKGESKPIVVQVPEDMTSVVDASYRLEAGHGN